LLVKRGYFNGVEEGSDDYKDRLQKARDRFFLKFDTPPELTKEQKEEEGNKHKNKANELLKDRKWAEAVEEYTTAINYCQNAVFYANRSVPLGKLSRFDEAIEDCKSAIACDPTYAKAYMRLGFNYFQTKDFPKAIEAYKKALTLDPTNATIKSDLAKAEAQATPNQNPQEGMQNMYTNMMQNMGLGGQAAQGMDGMGGQVPANFMEMMSNPQFMQAAQQFVMSNPQLMQWAQQVAQNPEVLQEIMQGRIPDGMPMPDNVEELMQNMPPDVIDNLKNIPGMPPMDGFPGPKKDGDGSGGMGMSGLGE